MADDTRKLFPKLLKLNTVQVSGKFPSLTWKFRKNHRMKMTTERESERAGLVITRIIQIQFVCNKILWNVKFNSCRIIFSAVVSCYRE